MRQLLARLRPKRSWLQFRLRTLLLLVTLLAVWLGLQADRARRQARAVQALGNTALFVVFDYQMPDHGPWTEEQYDNADTQRQPPGPAWLRWLIGDDYFRTVVGARHLTHETIPYVRDLPQLGGFVNLDPNVRDEDLLLLARATKLQGLNLSCNKSELTDAGLQNLRGLANLEQLWLGDKMTGVGLTHLRELPNLRSVACEGATAAGLEQAAALPALEELVLYNCLAIRDDDLASLAGARRLKRLSLHLIAITDAGLARLESVSQLESLSLCGLPITDAGLERLAHLPHLKHLAIYQGPLLAAPDFKGPPPTAEGLRHLASLPELETLTLEGFPLSDAELERLRQDLPKVRIER